LPGLHGVERERIAIALIGMEYAHRGASTVREQREARFRFHAREKVVSQRIDR
jgi:hypothetical protein